MTPPFITLEEHFLLDSDEARRLYAEQLGHIPDLAAKLGDLGQLRLASMDANNVSMQVVSHGPGPWTAAQCRAANDELAAAVRAHPTRLAGFAALPVTDPAACAAELRRCVAELGFVGALVDNRAGNTYFDGPAYAPLWTAAQDLDVPVYLHPTWPSAEQTALLYSSDSFSAAAGGSLGTSSWGWHADVALHVLRLFAAGTFDRFPRLKLIVGHMGEMLPFMRERVARLSSARWGAHLGRSFRDVYDENLWITTSGVWSVDPLATVLRNTRPERILYSVDYPFARNEDGLAFWRELEASGLATGEQLERIAYRNAEELLGIKISKTTFD